MIQLRKSGERGHANHGWLKSKHTFSFADYHDPKHMGFRTLKVINEDRIDGGTGFGSHPHQDMEIISYVISGALKHKDSMGTKALIQTGEIQKMSAGTGVVHSEHNAMPNEETHFFQIWITPEAKGGTPSYGQKSFEKDLNTKKKVLVISKDARDGSIGIKQDADIYISRLTNEDNLEYKVKPGRGIWIQVINGKLIINGKELSTGDAISFESVELLKIKSLDHSEFMLFDLA